MGEGLSGALVFPLGRLIKSQFRADAAQFQVVSYRIGPFL